ncbi:hypothetical protein ACOZ4Y_04965 [Komagataeibacter rhaeticus]
MKSGDASTLAMWSAGAKALLPAHYQKLLPPDVKVSILGDASAFVKDAVRDVVQ